MTHFLRKYKKTFFYCLFAFSAIIVLVIANFLSSLILPANSHGDKIFAQSFDLHLISLSKSQVEKEAKSRAEDFQCMGAGGYVWENEDYFHIISSGYLNKTDAQLVQNSIKLNQGFDSSLITISFPSYALYGSFDEEEEKVITALLNAPLNFYHSIYDIAISLDTNILNETGAKLNVNNALNDYAKTISNFKTLFEAATEENIMAVYKMAEACYSFAQKLALCEMVNEKQNYSSLLKYRYLEILHKYYDFVK